MRRRSAPASFIAVAALVLAACGSDTDETSAVPDDGENSPSENTQSGDTESDMPESSKSLRFGVLPCAADCGFLRMAQEQDFYAKYGVDVEFVELQSAAQIYPALAAAEVDIIEQSPGGLLIGAEQGGMDATVVGSSMEGLPYAIYASSDITDLSELSGRSMAISSPTGLPALVAELMVESADVDWSTVKTVNAGGNADRYRAVVAGTADAASSPADYVPLAEEEGVNVLALSSDVIPDFPRYMLIARNYVLEEKGDAVAGFLAGHIEGLRYAYEHPDEAKRMAADALETDPDDPLVTYMHDLIVDSGLVDPDGGISMDKLRYQEEVLINTGQLEGTVELETLVDDSYQQRALEMVESP